MTEEVQNKTNGRKKAAIAGGALGLGALVALGGGTLAAWNDAETTETAFEAGGFATEISVDGGETWLDGETAIIDVSDIVDDVDGNSWRPGDSHASTVLVRAADETTHDGTIVEVEEAFTGIFAEDADWISYSLDAVDGNVIPADGTPAEYEFTISLDNVEEVTQGGSGSAEYQFNAELLTEVQNVGNTITNGGDEDGGDAGEEG